MPPLGSWICSWISSKTTHMQQSTARATASSSQYLAYAKNILVVTFVIQLIITGTILPWVEELYFRGYLLPRISRFGWWTPLLSGSFFGLYHSWQPHGFLTVFLLGTALSYLVMWKRDIRLSIGLHIFANTFARLAFLMAALTM